MTKVTNVIDLVAARKHREELAEKTGATTDDMQPWDRLLLLADRAWCFQDPESLADLMGQCSFLAAQPQLQVQAN